MVMVQAEVAERLAAEPCTKEYGVPSAKMRFFGDVRRYGMVSPTVFWPIPRVYSGLVRIDRYQTAPWPTDDVFRQQVFELIDTAFAQRRKTVRNAFLDWAGSGNESAERLLSASIDPARRGETLTIADFVRLLERSGTGRHRRGRRAIGRGALILPPQPLPSSGVVQRQHGRGMVTTGSVTVRVPGKVNLYLVGDRRADGYHELTTVFHAVSLSDDVTYAPPT